MARGGEQAPHACPTEEHLPHGTAAFAARTDAGQHQEQHLKGGQRNGALPAQHVVHLQQPGTVGNVAASMHCMRGASRMRAGHMYGRRCPRCLTHQMRVPRKLDAACKPDQVRHMAAVKTGGKQEQPEGPRPPAALQQLSRHPTPPCRTDAVHAGQHDAAP